MCREWELCHKLLTAAVGTQRSLVYLSCSQVGQAQRTSILGNFLCMVFIVIVLSHSSTQCILKLYIYIYIYVYRISIF